MTKQSCCQLISTHKHFINQTSINSCVIAIRKENGLLLFGTSDINSRIRDISSNLFHCASTHPLIYRVIQHDLTLMSTTSDFYAISTKYFDGIWCAKSLFWNPSIRILQNNNKQQFHDVTEIYQSSNKLCSKIAWLCLYGPFYEVGE